MCSVDRGESRRAQAHLSDSLLCSVRIRQQKGKVDIAAGSAKNDFGALVQEWQSRIEDPRERLNETFNWRARYRERNRLQRPAIEFEGWIKVFSLTIILVVSLRRGPS